MVIKIQRSSSQSFFFFCFFFNHYETYCKNYSKYTHLKKKKYWLKIVMLFEEKKKRKLYFNVSDGDRLMQTIRQLSYRIYSGGGGFLWNLFTVQKFISKIQQKNIILWQLTLRNNWQNLYVWKKLNWQFSVTLYKSHSKIFVVN